MEDKDEYQRQVEDYLEENEVYDIFEDMLKEIIVDLPPDPVSYLLEKLQSKFGKVLYFIGNNGKARREFIYQHMNNDKNVIISMQELINTHLKNQGHHSKEISDHISKKEYIPDEIILELLESELAHKYHKHKNLILEGVPRTRVQCLALHEGGIKPSRVLILKQNIHKDEDNYHLRGIKEIYPDISFETSDTGELEVLLNLKTHSDGPKRPPRVVVLGPPGAGRSTQAQALSSRYGLSFVSPNNLLHDQIQRGTELSSTIQSYFSKGEYVPDSILIPLIISRLVEPDCLLKGWVLDGFPKTLENLKSLEDSNINPTHAIFLESTDSLVYSRNEERRLDPVTGDFYNIIKTPEKPNIKKRLILLPEDTHENIKKRLQAYKENLVGLKKQLEPVCVLIDAKEPISLISEKIFDAIENNKKLDIR
jgi:adenylate kinase